MQRNARKLVHWPGVSLQQQVLVTLRDGAGNRTHIERDRASQQLCILKRGFMRGDLPNFHAEGRIPTLPLSRGPIKAPCLL